MLFPWLQPSSSVGSPGPGNSRKPHTKEVKIGEALARDDRGVAMAQPGRFKSGPDVCAGAEMLEPHNIPWQGLRGCMQNNLFFEKPVEQLCLRYLDSSPLKHLTTNWTLLRSIKLAVKQNQQPSTQSLGKGQLRQHPNLSTVQTIPWGGGSSAWCPSSNSRKTSWQQAKRSLREVANNKNLQIPQALSPRNVWNSQPVSCSYPNPICSNGILRYSKNFLDFGDHQRWTMCAAPSMATFILSQPLAVSDKAGTGSQHPWQRYPILTKCQAFRACPPQET